jgi:multidrug efflux system membrane fusion protein
MRIFSILTALVVVFSLYMLVIERDTLRAFAQADATAEDTAGDDEERAELRDAVSVVALSSTATEIDRAVLLRGQTEAARQVDVRAETSGVVISDPLRKGAFVEAGDVLCRIDPGTRQATLAETEARLVEARSRVPEAEARLAEARSAVPAAQASLVEAEARLAEAEINFNAADRLSADGFASDTRVAATRAAMESALAGVGAARSRLDGARAGVESAKSQVENAKSGIQAAEAAVAAAENEIARLTITAPFAGLLESDAAELGALLQPGSLCANIIQLDPIKLVGFVPEAQVDRVKLGAPAGRCWPRAARSPGA